MESDEGTDDEAARTTRRQELEIVDIGGGTREDVEEDEADLEITECSLFPLTEHGEVMSMGLQQDVIHNQSRNMSREQKELK